MLTVSGDGRYIPRSGHQADSRRSGKCPQYTGAGFRYCSDGGLRQCCGGLRSGLAGRPFHQAKFTPYVVLGGHNLRYTTGSYVDSHGFNGELGFVKRDYAKGHVDTIMPFAEYGTGSFTSHLDSGARGDGSQHYVGGGLLMRRDLDNGVHYEGMVRAGHLGGDYQAPLPACLQLERWG